MCSSSAHTSHTHRHTQAHTYAYSHTHTHWHTGAVMEEQTLVLLNINASILSHKVSTVDLAQFTTFAGVGPRADRKPKTMNPSIFSLCLPAALPHPAPLFLPSLALFNLLLTQCSCQCTFTLQSCTMAAQSNIVTHTRACTHMHIHVYTRTHCHTHTHTRMPGQSLSYTLSATATAVLMCPALFLSLSPSLSRCPSATLFTFCGHCE